MSDWNDGDSQFPVEMRLAAFAARLVLTVGLDETVHVLENAAFQAASTRRRIAQLAGGAAPPPEKPPVRSRAKRGARRHAHALARRVERLSPAGGHGLPVDLDADVGADAAELLLLLAFRRDPAAPDSAALAAGRQLLLLTLPDGPWRRSFLPAPSPSAAAAEARLRRYPIVLLLYATSIVVYLLLRYRGHYVEQDTAAMTQLIETIAAYGSAIPGPNVSPVYPSGFGFQAVNLYLMRLSGIDIQALQHWFWPFLLLGIAMTAFLAFREMTGDDRIAALGGLFLFMQPDFLFTALRGSHEKMTYCLLLAALLLLFRSYRFRDHLWIFAGYVALFYLVMFGIVCTNSTFGSSLIVALTLSFFGGTLFSRLLGVDMGVGGRALIRLAYASFSSFLVLFAELFYFYQPSAGIFYQFQSAMDRLAGFALSFSASDNPYAYVSLGWRTTWLFFVLTAFTWLTIAVSGIAWLGQTSRFLRGGWQAAPDHLRLRWLFYAGLALQVGLGIAIDFAGVLGANLQLRLFPVYMFVAIPTSSAAVVGILDRLSWRPVWRVLWRLTAAGGTACFTALSAFKATNEPLLSNKWTFYSATEAQAMDWLEVNIPTGSIWSDVDERLREVDVFRSNSSQNVGLRYPTLLLPEDTPTVMLSHITRARLARLGLSLPDLSRMNEVYDNGFVQVYRQLPLTPLQR